MKVMIGRNEQGRALVKALDKLNLQDLTNANDDQIKVVTNLVWEIKGLFYALIKNKASNVLGNLNIGGKSKLSATLVADLTASIPRDVVISAQQQWLPHLAAETALGPGASDQELSSVATEAKLTGSAPVVDPSGSDAPQAIPEPIPQGEGSEAAVETDTAEAEPEVAKEALCAEEQPRAEEEAQAEEAAVEIDIAEAKPDGGNEALSADEQGGAAIKGRLPLPSGTPRAIKARIKEAEKKAAPEDEAGGEADSGEGNTDGGEKGPCAEEQPAAEKAADAEEAGETNTAGANPDGGNVDAAAVSQPPDKATDQVDDLLFPTEEELRASKIGIKDDEKADQIEEAAETADTTNAKPDGGVSADAAANAEGNTPAGALPDSNTAAADPQSGAAPTISIESDVDPENWAEYGGWYRQDYAIFYRPTGHKDKFIYSWLVLTGPQASKGDTSPAAEVFDFLTNKDAQGSCIKCHSVDDIRGKGRVVNFSPPSVESKQGRFTNFIHEPHFGVMDNRGCLTCHNLEKGRSYLKSYEQGNPQKFVPSFGAVKKELCQTCHASGKARQDCLLCHKYHVNGATTPIMNTRNPAQ
jgi:hypothetical protein